MALRSAKYCQLVSFRRDGAAIATPVWFALDGERLYARTESPSGKLKRLLRNPHALVGACGALGRPRGPLLPARSRALEEVEAAHAEAVLAARFSLGRRLFYGLLGPWLRRSGKRDVYLELTPRTPTPEGDA